MYSLGQGVEKDAEEAKRWYAKASARRESKDLKILEELDEMRPELQKLANNLEANMPEVLTTWQDY